jgi:hypothetical protein
MSAQYEALKALAEKGLEAKYGAALGKAYSIALFGGYGMPGMVDGAKLVAAADNREKAGEEFTEDMVMGLATDVAKDCFTAALEAGAADALEAAGVTAESVASTAFAGLGVLLSSEEIGPEPPIPDPQPPAPEPIDPEPPAPAPPEPEPPEPEPPEPEPPEPEPPEPDPGHSDGPGDEGGDEGGRGDGGDGGGGGGGD